MRSPRRSAPPSPIIGCRRRAGRRACRVKLAVLADLHACKPWMDVERIEGIVAQVNALGPTPCCCSATTLPAISSPAIPSPSPTGWAGALAGLRAPLGVHAVLGNHDWWEERAVQERRCGPTKAGLALQNAGITLHENTRYASSRMGPLSGSPASAISGRSGPSGGAALRPTTASTISPARWRWRPTMRRSSSWRTSPTSFPRSPTALRSPSAVIRTAARCACSASRLRAVEVRRPATSTATSSRMDATSSSPVVSAVQGLPVRFGAPPEIVMIELGV